MTYGYESECATGTPQRPEDLIKPLGLLTY